MKLKIVITMDNEAFEPDNGPEAARILHLLADEMENGHFPASPHWVKPLKDRNGNEVGTAKVIR